MAATLPPIGQAGHSSQSPSIQQHRIPSPPQQSRPTSVVVVGAKELRRFQAKKDRDLAQKQQNLRSQQPNLNKRDTAQYRNSYKHNLCLDMLQDGFHKSFAELFALIKQQEAVRQEAGPESIIWNQILLEDEPEKLDVLKEYLTKAEAALRRGEYGEVYTAQHELATFFQQTGDKWLADHFFSACLATSASIKTGGGRMAAEGHCNVGLAQERSGEHFLAAEHFEQFYKLTQDESDWRGEDGSTLHITACKHLSRIYTTIGEKLGEETELEPSLQFLSRAYDMAKATEDKKLEGEASYRLGVAYEKFGDAETALTYLNGYLDNCRDIGDHSGIGKACQAIAKSYESQGKVEESIRYLDMFVEVAESSKEEKAISQACSDLGAIYNSLGKYEKASEYFNRSYQISRTLNDTEAISSSRVLFGVAAAHKMLGGVSLHIETGSHHCLERLIEWKDNRGDEFDKEIPQPEIPTKVKENENNNNEEREEDEEKVDAETREDKVEDDKKQEEETQQEKQDE